MLCNSGQVGRRQRRGEGGVEVTLDAVGHELSEMGFVGGGGDSGRVHRFEDEVGLGVWMRFQEIRAAEFGSSTVVVAGSHLECGWGAG